MTFFRKAPLAALIALGAALPAVAQVQVTTYSGYTENYGNNLTFSNPTGTATWTAINSNLGFPGYSWDAGTVFAADITSTLSVGTSGSYSFNLSSDDGSYVFIDGVLVGSEPGAHSAYTTTFSDSLSAGNHSIEVQFYNAYCCGSGVQVDLPDGVTLISSVPEPATTPMLFSGMGVLLLGLRRALRRSNQD